MLLAELDVKSRSRAVPGAESDRVFGFVDALEDRREQGVIGVGRVVRPGEAVASKSGPTLATGSPSMATMSSPGRTPAACGWSRSGSGPA